jgi:hypothetical protein
MGSNGLKEIDDSKGNVPRHKMASSKESTLETPDDLYYYLCKKHNILCELDAFSTNYYDEDGLVKGTNSKCTYNVSFLENSDLTKDLISFMPNNRKPTGIWSNHPFDIHEQVLKYLKEQWLKDDLDIIDILPANCVRPPYWSKYVEPYLHRGIEVEALTTNLYPLQSDSSSNGYTSFERKGEKTEFDSRNGMLVIRYFSKKNYITHIKNLYGELITP